MAGTMGNGPRVTSGTEQLVGSKGGVPSVRNAIAIMRFFQQRANEPATMTTVARATSMNPSTCFNILKTLEAERLVTFDPATKAYCLGLGLVDLAASVDGQRQAVQAAVELGRGLVDRSGFAYLVVAMTDREEFLVVDKVESRRPIKVTVSVGERFPANSSVLAKAYFAWFPGAAVDKMLDRLGLPAYSPKSITDRHEFQAHLAEVRRRGFATSVGEYYPDHNALAAPVFDRYGRVSHLLVMIGFAFELSQDVMEEYGALLRATAEEVTERVGGSYPQLL